MSSKRVPHPTPLTPEGYFRFTEWGPLRGNSALVRERWLASFTSQGIDAQIIVADGLAAVYREGVEAISKWTGRKRKQRTIVLRHLELFKKSA